jgi:hypothetical protein
MRGQVVYLDFGRKIVSIDEVPLTALSPAMKDAVLTWTELNREGDISKPASLVEYPDFMNDDTVLIDVASGAGPDSGAGPHRTIFFEGARLSEADKIVAEYICNHGTDGLPYAFRYTLHSGMTSLALTLSFRERLGVEVLLFGDER